MLFLYVLLALGMVVLLGAGVTEQRRHLANLHAIPLRVLVNGIRGKSSITRLCAGALRGGGLRAAAKTTGTAARYISPDGTEVPIYRKFEISNSVEQIGVVRQAAAENVEALVVECMAIDPSLQELNQRKLIQATIGVICNVREDHLTEMGPTLEDVARSLSRTLPGCRVCITADRQWYPVLAEEAARYGSRMVLVDPESVTGDEMDRFRFFTFKENVAIALAVAKEAGVDRTEALKGMWEADPDPGVLTVESYRVAGKTLHFANAFAANDPNSTVMNFQRLMESQAIRPPIFILINCRPDRVERNRQMGELVPELLTERLFVIGHPTKSAIAAVPDTWNGPILDLGGERPPDEIFREIVAHADDEASVVAIGNIHGQGERLLEYLEDLGTPR